MKGFEGKINLDLLSEEERAGLDEKTVKQIEYRNKYIDAKEAAQARLSNDETKDKPFDLSKVKDVNEAAILYAACANVGVKVEGMEKVFTKSPEGLIHNSDFGLMPEEAQSAIAKHNREIHDKMLDRVKDKSRVPGPVVAEKEISPQDVLSVQRQDQPKAPLKSAQNTSEASKFQQFVLQGLNPRDS